MKPSAEWLEVDGIGGFASGTISLERTRRYHALLLAATHPPDGRMVLVNGCEAWIETLEGRFDLSTQRYQGDFVHPRGEQYIESFVVAPWPRWRFRFPDGTLVEQQLVASHGRPVVALSWKLLSEPRAVRLHVRPLMSGRDYHHLHHENPAFAFAPVDQQAEQVTWRPYEGVPGITICANAAYEHEPSWYRNFYYTVEAERGLECEEDLASPGAFTWDLSQGEAAWVLSTEEAARTADLQTLDARGRLERIRAVELRGRQRFKHGLERAADAYIVDGTHGKTIVAGYPWFTDWGRDTFISLRGLCLANGRPDDARQILLAWAGLVSEGMLPNRFSDAGTTAEFNSVDASLWYIISVGEFLQSTENAAASAERQRLIQAVEAILAGYVKGTRYNIHMDTDGLIAAGEPGVQLTWMDAKVDDWVVTPRIGKPVEIQALWLNALAIAGRWSSHWTKYLDRGLKSFQDRFWNGSRGMLYDVVDVDHQPGTADPRFRPNQLFAAGGLPLMLVSREQARRVVDACERSLLTPVGLRTLAPDEPGYCPVYTGDLRTRDGAYHQGTVWPWLLGPFVDAWVRAYDGTGSPASVREQANERFLGPLLAYLQDAKLDHIFEIADAEWPHTPRGCSAQAWSVAEVLRLVRRAGTDVREVPLSAATALNGGPHKVTP